MRAKSIRTHFTKKKSQKKRAAQRSSNNCRRRRHHQRRRYVSETANGLSHRPGTRAGLGPLVVESKTSQSPSYDLRYVTASVSGSRFENLTVKFSLAPAREVIYRSSKSLEPVSRGLVELPTAAPPADSPSARICWHFGTGATGQQISNHLPLETVSACLLHGSRMRSHKGERRRIRRDLLHHDHNSLNNHIVTRFSVLVITRRGEEGAQYQNS